MAKGFGWRQQEDQPLPARHISCAGWMLVAVLAVSACHGPEQPALDIYSKNGLVVSGSRQLKIDFDVPAAGAVQVQVDQSDIDVSVAIHDADDRQLLLVDSPCRRFIPEHATLMLAAGRYSLRMQAVSSEKPSGTVSVLAQLRPGRATSRSTAASLRETAGAHEFAENADGGDVRAYADFSEAGKIWRQLDDPVNAARALQAAACVAHRRLNDVAAAIAKADQAAVLYRSAGRQPAEAYALLQASLARAELRASASSAPSKTASAEFDRARRDLRRAQGILASRHDGYAIAEVIHAQGALAFYEGKFDEGRARFSDAEARYEALAEPAGVVKSLANRAYMDLSLGRFHDATVAFSKVLEGNAGIDSGMRADMLNNSALARTVSGDFGKGVGEYLEALALQRQLRDHAGEARSLTGLAAAYFRLGENDRADALVNSALALQRDAQDPSSFDTMILAGDIKRAVGQLAVAQALHTEAARKAKTFVEEARAQQALSRDAIADGRTAEAIAMLDRALESKAGRGTQLALSLRLDRAIAHVRVKESTVAVGQLTQLEHDYESAGAPLFAAECFYWLAYILRDAGDIEAALRYQRQAIALIESRRADATSPDLRARLLASRRAIYDLGVDILLDKARDAKGSAAYSDRLWAALIDSQRFRSRSQRDIAGLNTTPVADSSAEMVALQHAMSAELATRQYQLDRLEFGGSGERLRPSILSDMVVLNASIAALDNRLPARFNASLPDASPAMARRMPDDVSVLVYFVTEGRSWLWVLNSDGIEGYELPSRSVLLTAVRAMRAAMLQSPASTRARLEANRQLQAVAWLLLPREARSLLRKRWILVPDDVLSAVPFAALPMGAASAGGGTLDPAVLAHSLTLSPAADIALRYAAGEAPSIVHFDRGVILFADADRAPATPGIAAVGESAIAAPPVYEQMPRLVGSSKEISMISQLLSSADVRIYEGANATPQAALSEATLRAGVVHFAMHAVADGHSEALTGMRMAPAPGSRNAWDGFLSVTQLAGVRMNADLVVLSGCETSVGEALAAEGELSLGHAFIGAGAQRVVSTLWRVPDAATAHLMGEFYRELQRGSTPEQALQSAQLDLLSTSAWQDPLYWAGFVNTIGYRDGTKRINQQ